MEITGDGECTPSGLSVCTWALLIATVKAILIGNCLLHSLKGMLRYDKHKWILGIRRVFLEPITSSDDVVLVHVTIMCCHKRRPREANLFYVLMASGRGNTIKFEGCFCQKCFLRRKWWKQTIFLSMPNHKPSAGVNVKMIFSTVQ